jgi:hypothetical protein
LNAGRITASNHEILNQMNPFGNEFNTGDPKRDIFNQPLPNITTKMFEVGSTNSTFKSNANPHAITAMNGAQGRYVYTSDASYRRNISQFNSNGHGQP